MTVWLPNSEQSASPTLPPGPTTGAKITTDGRKQIAAINSDDEPAKSDDPSTYFDWWTGDLAARTGWVEYAFAKPQTISESSLYWFDDTGHGAVRVPASWRILYKEGNDWKPVEATSAYGVARDQYNRLTFQPVTTTGLRLEVTMQPKVQACCSAGIQRWRVK